MKTLTIEIPNTVDINNQEAKTLIASSLYGNGKLTLGQASNLAGYNKITFIDLLKNYNVSVINHPVSQIENDVNNAKQHLI